MRPGLLTVAVVVVVLNNLLAFVVVRADNVDPNVFLHLSANKIENIYYELQNLKENFFATNNLVDKIKIFKDADLAGRDLKEISRIAQSFNIENIDNENLKAALKNLKNPGGINKLGEKSIALHNNIHGLRTSMKTKLFQPYDTEDDDTIYSENEVRRLMVFTDEIENLKYFWKSILDNYSNYAKEYFFDAAKFIKKAAKDFNMTALEFLYPNYSNDDIYQLDEVMEQLKPFYLQIHAYIRQILVKNYGAGVIKPKGPIPEHLYWQVLKRVWRIDCHFDKDFSHEQLNLYNIALQVQDFDAKKSLEMAEHFYESLGFDSFTELFWQNNIYAKSEKDNDDFDLCPGNVYDLVTNVTLQYCNDFYSPFEVYATHHELLAQVHDANLKKSLPIYFYEGYGLGEVVGKTVKLAAITGNHLKTEFSPEAIFNRNFHNAIESMFTLMYNYVDAKVLMEFMNGHIQKKDLNKFYWQLLEKYAGVEPPIDRLNSSFDIPVSLYFKLNKNLNVLHKVRNDILAYQFYEAICENIDHTSALHNCDFYNEKAIGEKLKKMLSLGSSKSYEEVLALLLPTEQKLNAQSLLKYYQPTQNWLKQHINVQNLHLGWEPTTRKIAKHMINSETEAKKFADDASKNIFQLYDQISSDLFSNKNKAAEYEDGNGNNSFWKTSASAVAASELTEISLRASEIDYSKFEDKFLRRAIKKLSKIGNIFVLGNDLDSFLENKVQLFNISILKDVIKYEDVNSAKPQYVALYPDIRDIYVKSRNANEIKYYWEAWRKQNSDGAKTQFFAMLNSFIKAASILETSPNQIWFKDYSPNFIHDMERVINGLKPLYKMVNQYVRQRLIDRYGLESFSTIDGAVPHHFVEQLLLQIWTNNSIIERDFPFAELPPNDLFVKTQSYDGVKLLRLAEDFYKSMGFDSLPEDFWTQRLKLQDTEESQTDCHATIYDMTPKVYMKYCAKIDYRKLLQAHGYMGRVYYAYEKRYLPAYFFDSHLLEYPVGEAIILSASTPRHLKTIGLAEFFNFNAKVLLNRLARMCIHTLFKLHQHFVHTKVVADYLDPKIAVNEHNLEEHYWKLMVKYAGIEPPSDRSSDNFDFPYEFYTDLEQNHQMKKFVSEVRGYQFYEKLCKVSKYEEDLNNCDFYGSVLAGDALKKMMQIGSMKPYKQVVKLLLHSLQFSADAMLNYYAPFKNWLEKVPNVPFNDFSKSKRKILVANSLSANAK